MADYPTRNPFPARGTSSAEETSLRAFLSDWLQNTPTALLPGVRGSVRLAEDYVHRFADEATRDGALACLYGAHGVGKTHTARHMMAVVNGEEEQTVQLYLRFQEGDFVAEYRRLVTQLSHKLLANLSQRYLGTLAGARASDDVRSRLDEDPAIVRELFDRHLVDAGEVLEAQAKEIAAVAGNAPQFQRALSFLQRPKYSDAAYDWLCGRQISPGDARALGVSRRIDDPLTCRYGLQVLTTLVTRGGRPFVLVLDQCEKFVLGDGIPVPGNMALLQSLVEVIPRIGGMLLLVVSDAGWDCMPPDLRQRIGAGAIHMVPLTPDEARQVLGAYINAARPGPDAGIWPFSDTGLQELLRHSGGNIRLLLQLSWVSFEAAPPASTIDAELVASASAGHSRAPHLADLAMLIEAKLLAAGLLADKVEDEGRAAAFLLPSRDDPRAVIELTVGLFDEKAAGARAARTDGRPILTAVVVAGYASPPVLVTMRNVVHWVLVADKSPAFSRALDEVVEQIASLLTGPASTESDEALRELKTYLVRVSSERRDEAATLSRNLAEVAQRLEREEDKQPPDWPMRRQGLTDRISEARAARAAADWEEFHKARAKVVADYRTRRTALATSLGATLLLVAFGVLTGVFLTFSPASALLGALILATGTAAALVATKPTGSVPMSPSAPPATTRDLDLIARALRPTARFDAADPVVRYAYALGENPDEGYRRLADALLSEPLALVRQSIAHRMSVSTRSPADCVPDVLRGLREGVPEVLLLLARRQQLARPDQPRVLRDLPPDLRILVALANPGAVELADGPVARHPAEVVLAALGVRGPHHPLARAVRTGAGEFEPVEIPPSELRAAARLLSPLERDGLGTYDWLPFVDQIDELYLFLEELLHSQEKNRSYRHKS
ncbi:hypothetical protein [Nonomuraea sp. NPDC005650]|uniref:hypothetical protein n=1 Tax=Nonomuraea sp. NPDC005650 TaxID=3157045 RepID=UPI0033B03B3E